MVAIQAINDRLEATLDEARRLLLGRFATITLADINADFEEKLKASPWEKKPELCG